MSDSSVCGKGVSGVSILAKTVLVNIDVSVARSQVNQVLMSGS